MPARQNRQVPSVQPSHGTPTRAPASKREPPLEHLADDLVAGDERQLRVGELAVDDVQVGPADAAGAHAQQDLPGFGLRIRKLREP